MCVFIFPGHDECALSVGYPEADGVRSTAASLQISATDSTGPSGSASFTWTVSTGTTGCNPAQLLGNPGFETGTAAPWSASASVIADNAKEPPHSGTWDAWLDGYGTTHTDTLSQAVTVPVAIGW